ncbi:MAG: DUF359 domain-containing protein [Candidatus Thorarchaeota archaeon]
MASTWALNLFDRLHVGHHVLIDRLSDMPEPVAAVTCGELVEKGLVLDNLIQPEKLRVENLRAYLKSIQLEDTIRIEVISTYEDLISIEGSTTFMIFEGPCCVEIEAKALDMRKEQLALPDRMELLKPVRAQDGDKMSSARIRLGEIDRQGRPLRMTSEPPRRLPDKRRAGLQTPMGEMYDTKEGNPEQRVVTRIQEEEPELVIAVGDVTSASLIAEGYSPDICVVDGITKRGVFEGSFSAEVEYRIHNPAAMILPEAWSVMNTAIHDGAKSLIFVEGEEDLMGFPAVLLAPEGSVMLYGQPDVGIVWVPVDKQNIAVAREYLNAMPLIT